MALNEITFDINRYKKPKILSQKESLPKVIMNVLFMTPGNLPGNPTKGGDVLQYLYQTEDALNETSLELALRKALGTVVYDTHISSVHMKAVRIDGGGDALLVAIDLREPNEERSTLAILMQRDVNNKVHYNYEYISDRVMNF